MLIEPGWTLWEALYFTLITTGSFGDETISETGQRGAALFLVIEIRTATRTLTTTVQYAVTYQFDWRRRMKQSSTQPAAASAERCSKYSPSPTFLASSSVMIKIALLNAVACGYLAIIGDTTNEQILHAAGLERVRGIICETISAAEIFHHSDGS